jgi:hypothetical protein
LKLTQKSERDIMSIQDRDEAADREFAKTSADENRPEIDRETSSPTKNETNESNESDRATEVTLEDKSREIKDHLMPSFQELDTPNMTLASTSKKVEELKANSVAIAEQIIVHGKDDPATNQTD